ncbi:hypothetical protein AN964_00820 [Heyndrickxia shackletonii]|uniref:Uncharacterized protein n=1 Tax=Heyndrickxia shackletonii TaxID=157838 RepID=A0A0Q3WTM0_9BACI|nr:hypothetical protein [Heyndrickxia shackletonii]KQL52223.1 hypothetical protein AN964_00820 [Heyndrickxia shackletonii]NEZ00241.1 hypothetical protein [Heyndrickxia shackletonii]
MKFDSTRINLSDLIIVNADHSSTISLGSTVQVNKAASAKKNQAIGQFLSDGSPRFFTVSELIDDDMTDFSSEKQTDME